MKTATILFLALVSASAMAQNELSTAKTFEVEEALGSAQITVQVVRPNKVMVSLQNNHGKDGTYIFDGKNAYEYHKWSNTFEVLDPMPNGHFPSILTDLSAVDLLLNGGKLEAASPDDTVTTGHDTLNGKEAVLTTVTTAARKGKDDKSYQNEMKVWSDATSGLPLRRVQASIVDGVEHPFQDLTFTSFRFDLPLAIAWKAPKGATEGDGGNLLKAGVMAPDFTAIGPDGKTVHLSDYRGKVVVLDFWATWCVPCQHAMPRLEAISKQLNPADAIVLGVCVWDKRDADNSGLLRKSRPIRSRRSLTLPAEPRTALPVAPTMWRDSRR